MLTNEGKETRKLVLAAYTQIQSMLCWVSGSSSGHTILWTKATGTHLSRTFSLSQDNDTHCIENKDWSKLDQTV